jgi:hypothetical protein
MPEIMESETFNIPREELIRLLYRSGLRHVSYLRMDENPALYKSSEERDLYTGFLRKEICKSTGMAYMTVCTRGEVKSALKLEFIKYSCDRKEPDTSVNCLKNSSWR